jgi:aminoglycoside phosphotransferase (APT) family kinase protein
MSDRKMHHHEIPIDVLLITKLLHRQFLQWSNLPLSPVQSDGTDNALYRLGTDMCIRLPRIPSAAEQVEKEHKWLPHLASQLPLAIPNILERGRPSEDYPWPWSICRWIEGENAATSQTIDLQQTAIDLANFIGDLHRIDSAGGPPSRRGFPLATQDKGVRSALKSLNSVIDTEVLTRIWEECLQAFPWDKPPVWIHGDLLPANLLIQEGKLSAIIDFGLMGTGDPACDLIPAWSLLTANTRDIFRMTVGVDDATWIRGQGWALSIALIILPYYWDMNPGLVAVGKRMIDEILNDY